MVKATSKTRRTDETISLVVPLFNTAGHLSQLLDELARSTDALPFKDLEVVFVDDSSTDDTPSLIENAEWIGRARLRLIRLHKNLGQPHATAIGIANSTGSIVVTLDDDLQHPVGDATRLVDALRADRLDFVVARIHSYKKPIIRRIASSVARWIARRSLGVPPSHDFSSFCAYDGDFVRRIRLATLPTVELGWMYRYSDHFGNVEVGHLQGIRPASNYSFARLVRVSRPLLLFLFDQSVRILVYLGLASLVSALSLIAYYLQLYFRSGRLLPGFATLVILLLSNLAISSFFLAAVARLVSRNSELVRSPRTGTSVSSGDLGFMNDEP